MKIILIGILCLAAGIGLGLLIGNMGNFSLTGKSIKESEYTHTKAICNSNGECIDVLVSCKNGEVESIEPISDLKDFSDIEDWIPPNRTGFCD
jgi:hypothetical protein